MLSLDSLNPAQRDAVTYQGDSHCLILAGAGSGKTRVLTHRIAWLLSQGTPAYSILAITFTNKAAREMHDRAIALIGDDYKSGLQLSTFHAFGARFIRRYAEYIGLTNQFSIYGESEQKALVKTILEELGFLRAPSELLDTDRKQNKTLVSETVDGIARLKEKGILPIEASSKAKFPEEKMTAAAYESYERKLIDNNAVDFAGLLLWPLRMLKKFDDIRQATQNRYRHILVDEFQDTNMVQLNLLSALLGPQTRLTAVGDDDQSIYAWRGADPKAILDFSDRFGACKILKLEQNYRSTKPILHYAANLIDCNCERAEKRLWTDREGGEPVHVVSYESDRDESWDIVRRIASSRQTLGNEWSDYAILYRKNSMSLGFESACTERGVPYQVVGSLGFFERAEIVDLLAYLRMLANPLDTVAFRRAINKPARNIGEKTAERIVELIEQKAKFGLSPKEAMIRLFDDIVHERCKIARAGKKTLEGCRQFYELLVELADWETMPLRRILEIIIEKTNYMVFLKAQMAKNAMDYDEAVERIDALKSTLEACEREESDSGNKLTDFLSSTSLVRPESDNTANSIKLMTIHGAKGLEFDTVFIAGVESNVLPLLRGGECDLEEERRLMYVAMTRAKRVLNISHAETRYEYGHIHAQTPSKFLDEMKRKDDPPGMIEESYGTDELYNGDAHNAQSRDRYKRPQLAWSKKTTDRRNRSSSFEDEVGGGVARSFGRKRESSFEDEVGGGVARSFGRKRESSFEDEVGGGVARSFGRKRESSFEDEVGGGGARSFGRKRERRNDFDHESDAPFYEDHTVSYEEKRPNLSSQKLSTAHDAPTNNVVGQALDKNGHAIEIGARVRHSVHGVGTVMRVEKASDGHKISVKFNASGTRTILSRFLVLV